MLAGLNTSFFEALDRIPLGVAVTIEFIGPLAVGLVGSRRALDLVWIAAAILGILALTHGSAHGLDAVGVLFGLAAAMFWAAYIFVSARVGQAFSDGTGLMIAMWVSVLATVPVGLADGGHDLLRPHALLLGLVVGVLSSALPYTLEMEALRRIATHVFGVLMSLEPAVAAFAGWLALGQQLSARELAGIVLVIVASVGERRLTALQRGKPSADCRSGRAADRVRRRGLKVWRHPADSGNTEPCPVSCPRPTSSSPSHNVCAPRSSASTTPCWKSASAGSGCRRFAPRSELPGV